MVHGSRWLRAVGGQYELRTIANTAVAQRHPGVDHLTGVGREPVGAGLVAAAAEPLHDGRQQATHRHGRGQREIDTAPATIGLDDGDPS